MAFVQSMPRLSFSDPTAHSGAPSTVSHLHHNNKHSSRQKFITDLSQCLFEFVVQLLPTQEEMAVKEDVRKLLERLIRTIEPDSRLLSFGSTANGFSLRNSDMDLCCLIDSEERLSATDLVTMLGDLLERETKFHVKPLPHARIPIVKLSLDPSPGLPLGIACDIGFENRLALENTRLLMCYAMIDSPRVRTLVLFLKVWSKRRKINSPYKGTLSSYGYVLLVIYFLVHVKNPPVLPNLQQMPPLRPISKEETQINGYNTWFFDDIDLLRQRWRSESTESVGQLLVDFFRYYSRDFSYNSGVASIRAGLLKKESKGWQNDLSAGRYNDSRERNRLCIEDPFEVDFNVARCVTKDGLYTIRGEFMRASRILAGRPERAVQALAQLCEERKDDELVSAPPPHGVPRLSNPPPQTPFPVGSQSMRHNNRPDRLSPTTSRPTESINHAPLSQVAERSVPAHMAPKRGKWTSPPPAEAPFVDHALFEAQLGKSLQLATAPSNTREKERERCNSSPSSNSEMCTDGDRSDAAESDDITSVRSFTEGTSVDSGSSAPARRPSWHLQDTLIRAPQAHYARDGNHISSDLLPYSLRHAAIGRNHYSAQQFLQQDALPLSRSDSMRRQIPGASMGIRGIATKLPNYSKPSLSPASVPLPASPEKSPACDSATTVYYQTTGSPRTSVLYPGSNSGSPRLSPHMQNNPFLSQLHQHQPPPSPYTMNNVPQDILTTNGSGIAAVTFGRASHHRQVMETSRMSPGGHDTPTPILQEQLQHRMHGHTRSVSTVTAPTPPPPSCSPAGNSTTRRFSVQARSNSPLIKSTMKVSSSCNQRSGAPPRLPSSSSPSLSIPPSPRICSNQSPISRPSSSQRQQQMPRTPAKPPLNIVLGGKMDSASNNIMSPQHSVSTVSNGSSPALSSTGTGGYQSSPSRSPSPHSPRSPPSTAVPIRRTGRTDGGGEVEEGRIFESFAALNLKDNINQQPLHVKRHHLVTDDPAVLVVSPPVEGHMPSEKQ